MCETCKIFQRQFFRQAAFYLNIFQVDAKEIEEFFEPWQVVELYNRVEFQLILEAWREHVETVHQICDGNGVHLHPEEMADVSRIG